MVAQAPNIFVVDNKDGRNEQFLPLFTAMKNAGYGKLEKNYFIINSGMRVQQDNKTMLTFALIQNEAIRRGFSYVMYYL